MAEGGDQKNWSCVCIYRLRPDEDAQGSYLMIKVVDDPFCPTHHPGDEVLDGTGS